MNFNLKKKFAEFGAILSELLLFKDRGWEIAYEIGTEKLIIVIAWFWT